MSTHSIVALRAGRRVPMALVFLLALVLTAPLAVRAQDETDETPEAGSARIISTEAGEVPSTGGSRSVPVLQSPPVARVVGVQPIAIQIEEAEVDAEIEQLEIVDGVMQNPTGPWVVSWYEDLAGLGEGGNVVMAGHVDYWNVGPAVFYSIDDLGEGDEIDVTGADGSVYSYSVEWVRQYDADDAPLEEIVGGTTDDSLTLITCGGTFDYTDAEYLQRTVVRATRVVAA